MNSITSVFGVFGIIGTALISLWAALRYIVLGSYRINGEASKRLFDKIEKSSRWTWVLSGEHVIKPKYPEVFEALTLLEGTFLYFARTERLFTAGWKNKDDVSNVTFFRWQRKRIDEMLKFGLEESSTVPITSLVPGSQDRLGELETDSEAQVFLNKGSYEDIERDVKKMLRGEIKKTGCLLHGPPGSGKTQFAKYIAKKYSLPIYAVYLQPDYSNYDIIKMFSEIPRRCIVLLEDFDSYFHGRECIIKNEQVRFTFDAIINALDGVHNDYREVMFVMTTNDIEKVDEALKTRPSRLKFVREFGPPDAEVREKILNDPSLVEETEGMTLDQVFFFKDQQREKCH